MAKDYYNILGVSKNAVLSDRQKRAQYDQFGTTFEGAAGQGGFGGFDPSSWAGTSFSDFMWRGGSGGAEGFDLGDIFGDFFGGVIFFLISSRALPPEGELRKETLRVRV